MSTPANSAISTASGAAASTAAAAAATTSATTAATTAAATAAATVAATAYAATAVAARLLPSRLLRFACRLHACALGAACAWLLLEGWHAAALLPAAALLDLIRCTPAHAITGLVIGADATIMVMQGAHQKTAGFNELLRSKARFPTVPCASDPHNVTVGLMADAVVCPFLLALPLRFPDGRRFRLLILPDSVDTDTMRALLVAIRTIQRRPNVRKDAKNDEYRQKFET